MTNKKKNDFYEHLLPYNSKNTIVPKNLHTIQAKT